MRRRLAEFSRNAAAPAFLATAIVLGGASGPRAGVIANAVLQMMSLGIILYCVWTARRTRLPQEARPLVFLGLAFIVFVLLTLVPLPPGLWRNLSGRELATGGLGLIGIADQAFPISLSPQRTMASLLWVLPPAAAFLLILRTADRGRKMFPVMILVVAILLVGLGVAQLISGPTALRPYQITNPGRAVGLFANTNHFATFLLCALPFSGYLAARAVRRESRSKRMSGLAVAGTTGALLVIGIGVVGSVAGIGLLVVTAAATLLIYKKASAGRLNAVWLGGTGILFLALLAAALTGPLQEKAITGKLNDERTSRKVMARTTVQGIERTFPIGTGLGTMPLVYRSIEDERAVGDELVNHTHNDYLEVALELGLAGILFVLCFILWWVARSFQVWRSNVQGSDLGRVGSVIILVVLLHSIVDYPVRTSAIAALIAVGCALMIQPARSERRSKRRSDGSGKVDLMHLEAD